MLEHQDKIRCCGRKIPQYFWFVLSGAMCDVVQALIDYVVSIVYPFDWEKPTVCWAVSYILSIVLRHSSHRLIVFGEFEGSYCVSLGRTFGAYAASIFLSVTTNHILTGYFEIPHRNAWILTMLWTGIFNYFMLKTTWRSKARDSVLVPNISDLYVRAAALMPIAV